MEMTKPKRDPNAEFDYPCAEAREFYAKEAGDINESNIISSKTLADLFRRFDEKENKQKKVSEPL